MEDAAEWLAAMDAGTASRQDFEAWRAGDPRRAVAFAQVVDACQQIDRLRAVHERAPAPPQRLSRRTLMRAGAIAGGTAVAGGFLAVSAAARDHAATAVGERRTLILDDGTRVEMNTDTRISWRIKDGARSIWLEAGEIALDVRAPAGTRPDLRLSANGTDFNLRGGLFNARLQPESLDLLVLSGQAEMEGGARKTVKAGTFAQVIGRNISVRPAEPVALDRAQSWKNGQLVFEGESLDFVVAEFNRYLTDKLLVADPKLSRIRLGGRFTTTDPKDLLAALRASFGVHAQRSESGAIMLTAS